MSDAIMRLFSARDHHYISLPHIVKSDEEWKAQLTLEQYRVTRKQGTEAPCSGALLHEQKQGVFACVCCGNDLFWSEAKFESGTGWPSFFQPVAPENIRMSPDYSYGMERMEILCARCDAHLGHMFEDGPPPTGRRFCMNSIALIFYELPPDGAPEKV